MHKDTVPLTAFCTPTGLCEWLVMPLGSSALPGWFVKVINEVIKDLKEVAAYLEQLGDVLYEFPACSQPRRRTLGLDP